MRLLLFGGLCTGVVYLRFFAALQIEPHHGLLAPLFARDS